MSKCYYCGGSGCPECANKILSKPEAPFFGGGGFTSNGIVIGGAGGSGAAVDPSEMFRANIAGASELATHGYPQCVSVDNPDDIEGCGWVGRPAVGGMAPGLVLRRRDGSFRRVTDVDLERRLYVTERFGRHPYALVPAGWVEVERIT